MIKTVKIKQISLEVYFFINECVTIIIEVNMKCINCNKRISSEVTFCPYCGVSINEDNSVDYFKTYIGNNYDKLTTKSFSWNSLFFGFMYFFYRKMCRLH